MGILRVFLLSFAMVPRGRQLETAKSVDDSGKNRSVTLEITSRGVHPQTGKSCGVVCCMGRSLGRPRTVGRRRWVFRLSRTACPSVPVPLPYPSR
jgi:hypothetical protein